MFCCLVLAGCDQSTTTGGSTATNPQSSGADADSQQAAAQRAVVAETLAYAEVDEQLVKGHFVIPEDMVELYPGIILIHEWQGLNDDMRALADRLAGEGFIVLAIDLYGGRSASTPTEARALMVEVLENQQFATDNIRQAAQWVRMAGAPRVATVGFGFGGGWSLNAAVQLESELDAAVVFYGQVSDNETTLASISAPVLALFGEDDSTVPSESVEQFEIAMQNLGKDIEIQRYKGSKGGFATPGHRNFQPGNGDDAWRRMIAFLNTHMPSS